MKNPRTARLALLLSVLGTFSLFGAALAQSAAPPAITPPAGNTLLVSAFGTGIQIYRSQLVGGTYHWVFVCPTATLFTEKSEVTVLATHFAGPSWQDVLDGSVVAGKVAASAPSPTPGAIPQLLLTAKSHRGAGLLSQVSYIQRINTVGGTAPSTAPTLPGQEADVPYTATYNFYAPMK